MNSSRQSLINEIKKIYVENGLIETAFYDKCINDLVEKLPQDELITSISAKWNNRSRSIELIWDINSFNLYQVDVSYCIAEKSISWQVKYFFQIFNEKNKEKINFIECLNECLSDIRYTYKEIHSKLTTKGAFYNKLKSVIDCHIGATIHDKDYDANEMVLGINRNNFRPSINKREMLVECDIYELDDFVKSFSIYDDYWELVDDSLFWQFANQYIKEDNNDETRLSQVNVIKKISSSEFCELFYNIMCRHLKRLNDIKKSKNLDKPIAAYFYIRLAEKRYLGIEPHSLKPFIGVLEGLDGCDVYELKEFENSFKIDGNGFFVSKGNDGLLRNRSNFLLENKRLLNLLVAKYFLEDSEHESSLPLIKKADESFNDDDSRFIRMYKEQYHDFTLFLDPTILGKYNDTSFCENYVFLSKEIYEYIEQIQFKKKEISEKIELGEKYFEKATYYKRKKLFNKAVEWYEKCKELNVGYVVYHELLICYRQLADYDKELAVATEAYERFPENVEYKKAYLKLTGNFKSEKLICNWEGNEFEDIGHKYENEIHKLPEYTFDINDHPFHKLFFQDIGERERIKERKKYYKFLSGIKEVQTYFKEKIDEAKKCEELGQINDAVIIYERLIAENCYRKNPFERLIIIYTKENRVEDLIRVLEYGINHFTSLEKRQFEYIQYLAKKYKADDKLEKALKIKAEIKYWFGNIVLYQKYSFIDNWKKRLDKVKTSV